MPGGHKGLGKVEKVVLVLMFMSRPHSLKKFRNTILRYCNSYSPVSTLRLHSTPTSHVRILEEV